MAPRNCCTNCHFLIKRQKLSDNPPKSWNHKDRDGLSPRVEGPQEEILQSESQLGQDIYEMGIGCLYQLWTDDHNENEEPLQLSRFRLRDQLTQNRKDGCFFVDYHPGMSIENAERLFEVRRENSRSKRGVFWSIFTAISAIVISLFSLAWQVYETIVYNTQTPPTPSP